MTSIELRILFIIGLIATAVSVYAIVVGTVTAARWLGRRVDRVLQRRALEKPATPPPGVWAGANPIRTDPERRLRSRHAAWRLRC